MKMAKSVLEKMVRLDRCDTQLSECGSPAKLRTSALERSERPGRRVGECCVCGLSLV